MDTHEGAEAASLDAVRDAAEASASAFWVVGPRRGEIRRASLPQAGPGEIVVRALYSGISRGTESLVFRGGVPAGEYQRMRAPFQEGELPWPVKYGYSNVGTVEQGPDELRGREVFVLYPHQSRYVVPASAAHPLPEGVPAARAVLAANMETAVNGVWDAGARPGERVTVVGAGAVGCLVAYALKRLSRSEVVLVDVNPAREAIARRLDIGFAVPARAPRGAGLIVHTSGSPEGLELSLDIAGFEATILEMSWYGTREVTVPLGGSFHSQRLTLKSSQVGHVAPAQRDRFTRRQRLELALTLLTDPALDTLVTGETPFEELPRVMAGLAEMPGETICHRIRYADQQS